MTSESDLSKAVSELAFLKGKLAAMQAPAPFISSAQLYSVDKGMFGGTLGPQEKDSPLEVLFNGVRPNPEDRDSITKSGARMIENMLRHPHMFGKPLMDVSFRGLRGR